MRLFIALDLPENIRDYLFNLESELTTGVAKVRWVSKRNLHLTLKFIGEVKEDKVKEIADKLESKPSWELGVMIETPSAAILTSEISEEVDFLSIGTNDLIQYTLAVDRINEHVSYLFSHFHPAVLRLLNNIREKARKQGVPVSVCGEMAGQLSCVPLLVGLGVDELSMNIYSIPKVKKLLNSITKSECEEILGSALKLKTTVETRDFVIHAIMERWGNSLPSEFIQEIVSS